MASILFLKEILIDPTQNVNFRFVSALFPFRFRAVS